MLTQRKIAETLGLSCATVTNILSGKPGLRYSAETRQRVLTAASELGYQPNRSWQAVRRGRSNLIGIITVGAAQEIARRAASLLPLEINASGYDYMVVDLHWHGGSVERVLDELIKSRVEGVVVSFMVEAFGSEYIDRLKRAGIPIVAVDGDERLGIPVIWNDIRSAFFQVTRHLQEKGHRQLVMVTGASLTARPVRERIEGFQSAMEGIGLCEIVNEAEFPERWRRLSRSSECAGMIVHVCHDRHGHNPTKALYAFAKRLFAGRRLPDALVCSNDAAAFGVFSAAIEMGIAIPGDMALTGADNDEFGEMPAFGLTTIDFDIEQACRMAIKTLTATIRSGGDPGVNEVIDMKLIPRSSSGRERLRRGEKPDLGRKQAKGVS